LESICPKNNTLRIRCRIKIYKQAQLIFESDFFDFFTIPNLIFEGNPIFNADSHVVNQNKQKQQQLQKKESENINLIKEQEELINPPIQYRLECTIDNNESSNFIFLESKIEWKISVFSSENIGFVKDTSKEDAEKAIIESWEINQPGRSQKAKLSRNKFMEEKKTSLEIYMNSINANYDLHVNKTIDNYNYIESSKNIYSNNILNSSIPFQKIKINAPNNIYAQNFEEDLKSDYNSPFKIDNNEETDEANIDSNTKNNVIFNNQDSSNFNRNASNINKNLNINNYIKNLNKIDFSVPNHKRNHSTNSFLNINNHNSRNSILKNSIDEKIIFNGIKRIT